MVHSMIILGLLWLPIALTQEQEPSLVKVNEVIKNFLSQINDLMDSDNREKAEEIMNRLNAANLTVTPQQRQSLNQRTREKFSIPPFHRSYIQRRNVSSIAASISGAHVVPREGSIQRIHHRQPVRREEIADVIEKITEISKPKANSETVKLSPLTVHRPPVPNQQVRVIPRLDEILPSKRLENVSSLQKRKHSKEKFGTHAEKQLTSQSSRLGISTSLKTLRRPANFRRQTGKTQKTQVNKQARQPLRRTQFRNSKKTFKSTEKIEKPVNRIQNRVVRPRPDEPIPRPAVSQQKMQLGVRDHMVVLMPTTDEPENQEPSNEKTSTFNHIKQNRQESQIPNDSRNSVKAIEVSDNSNQVDSTQQNRTPAPEIATGETVVIDEPRPKFDRIVPYNPQAMLTETPVKQPQRAPSRRFFRQRHSQEASEASQQRRQEQSLEQSLNMELFEVFKKYNVTGFVLKSGEFSVKAIADPSRTQFIPASLSPNDINVENSKRRRKLHEFEDEDLNVILTGALRNQTQAASSRSAFPLQAPPDSKQTTPTRKGLERPRHFPLGKKEQIADPFSRVQRDQKGNLIRNERKWPHNGLSQRRSTQGRRMTLAEGFQKNDQSQELW